MKRSKWLLLIGFIMAFNSAALSQIEVSHMLPRDGKQYGLGFGCVLKFSFLSGDADFITVEGAGNFYFEKEQDRGQGIVYFPLKIGYKYTLNRAGTGVYVEPQLGFNVYGVASFYDNSLFKDVDRKFNGGIAGMAAGFLFEPDRWGHQFDLSAYSESIISKPVTATAIGLRVTYNLSFGGSR